MNISISKGNSKIGAISNFNLPPFKSCGKNCKYCIQTLYDFKLNKKVVLRCYASRYYNMYPNVKKSYDHNFEIVKSNLNLFKSEMIEYLSTYTNKYFRIHASGDFFNQNYLNAWIEITKQYPAITFLAFTKQNNLNYEHKPDNFIIRLSIMPNMPKLHNKDITLHAYADLYNEHDSFNCIGNCTHCKYCYRSNGDVFFKVH